MHHRPAGYQLESTLRAGLYRSQQKLEKSKEELGRIKAQLARAEETLKRGRDVSAVQQ